jgi:uncharacterized alkaline shock family protein YloU
VTASASAEAVAAAAASCPGVVRLASGSPTEIATYLPGQRIRGVRIRDRVVEVHIVAAQDQNLPELAETVRDAVVGVAPGHAVDVYVDDLDVSTGDTEPADAEAAEAESAGSESAESESARAEPAGVSRADTESADRVIS